MNKNPRDSAALLHKPKGFRIHALDGLRGWASLAVAAYHLIVLPLGIYVPQLMAPVPYAFVNGELAVAIFFVMSGFVLSIPFWKHPKFAMVAKLSFARYFRLTIPILGACALVNLAVLIFGNNAPKAATILASPTYRLFAEGPLPWPHIGLFSTILVYVVPGENTPIPFLWTMRTEMIGSFILFATFAIGLKLASVRAALVVMLLALAMIQTYLMTFLVGALLGWMFMNTDWLKKDSRKSVDITCAVAIIGIVLALNGLHNAGRTGVLVNTACATLIMALSVKSGSVTRFLSTRLSLFLGSISFPLYLVHYVVFAVLFPKSILALHAAGKLSPALAVAVALAGLGTAIVIAMLFMPVERFSINVSRQFSAFAISRLNGILAKLDDRTASSPA